MKRIYIAGKMSGLPEMGYPAFNAEAARLRALGYNVENPAENPEKPTWAAYMRQAIRQMLTCDAVALLPNWKQSRGALIEHGIAIALGIPARPCEEFQGELDVITRSNYIMRTTKGIAACQN
jgi:nucleoside 2-deoxyribosyltransferase